LYFSVVTFTTVGYGDIVMTSTIGKLIVISEILLGYLMGGLLVGIFIEASN
jgi:voltage-gated potassium channel Kch